MTHVSLIVQNASRYLYTLFNSQCFLGSFYGERFGEKKVQCAVTKFVKTLANIEDKIKERNKSLDVPYEYLLPSKVPNTIAI